MTCASKKTTLLSMTVVAALLALPGCGKKSTARTPDPSLQYEARIESTPAPAAPSTAAASSGRTIRGPRSEAEIAEAYRIPELVPVRPMSLSRAPLMRMPDEPVESITADPSWDVTITREWRHIVVHHSASVNGSAGAFDKAHRERGWDGLGYHFVIGNGSLSGDGEVEVGYRWRKQMQGAHAGNAEYNQAGIGICLVGDFEHGQRPSGRQMASLRRLTRYLQVKTGVPTSEVIGHGNVPGKSTECPGKNLNLGDFRASLGGGAIGVPIHLARDNSPSRGPLLTRAAARSGASMP